MMTPQTLLCAQLRPAPWNPRGAVSDASLAELVESIHAQGVLTPLLVRPVPGSTTGDHEIIAGHRRWRAAEIAGLTEVPVRVCTYTDAEAHAVAIVENLQREDIRPLDEARAYEALHDVDNMLDGARSIAARIGKSVSYVWDRLQLLELIPAAQQLLAVEAITVQHAVILAKLTPEQQARVIDPDGGGLFTRDRALYETETDLTERYDDDGEVRNPWAGLKPVSVRELQRHVTDHVRFDPAQAASTAPLDFGPVALQVEEAHAQRKRGRKVIQITRDHYVQPDARSEERTYCVKAWKRADGREDSTACDRAVLGVVVVGPGYGEAFHVCIHKDCDVHWQKERLAREKHAAQSAVAGGTRPTRDSAEAENRKARERQARVDEERKAWEDERPAAAKAFAEHLGNVAFSEQIVRATLAPSELQSVARTYGVKLTKQTAAAVLLLSQVETYSRARFHQDTRPWKFTWPPKADVAAKAPAKPTPKAHAAKKTLRAKGKKR